MTRPRDFYVVRASAVADGLVDFALVGVHSGSLEEVYGEILTGPKYAPGQYLLLDRNSPVVTKPEPQ